MTDVIESASHKMLIMVCGAARSGTTMLDLMLGSSDAAFSTGEISRLFRPFRVHHKNPVCSCGEIDCAAWRGILDGDEPGFHARILQRPGVDYVVDSSKDLRWVLDSNVWGHQNGIPVKNVLIWKDPIDLSYSYWRRGLPIDFYRPAFITYYGRFLRLKLPFIAVNYKELVTQPEVTLRTLCSALEMTFDESQLEFWKKRHHHFFGSAGTRKQVGDKSASIKYNDNFPEEFLEQFEKEESARDNDVEFNSILGALPKHNIGQAGVDLQSKEFLTMRRPVWYYRHALKALWWKYFPQKKRVPE